MADTETDIDVEAGASTPRIEPFAPPPAPDVARADHDLRRRVARFHDEHGRAPRILHIGNIANNAYLNAKMLNDAGFDCDVICYDYYHIMGCPEWEDADFEGDIPDHFAPDWAALDLRGFERPEWFAQGPLNTCIAYLLARRAPSDQAEKIADRLREQLGRAQSIVQTDSTQPVPTLRRRFVNAVSRRVRGLLRKIRAVGWRARAAFLKIGWRLRAAAVRAGWAGEERRHRGPFQRLGSGVWQSYMRFISLGQEARAICSQDPLDVIIARATGTDPAVARAAIAAGNPGADDVKQLDSTIAKAGAPNHPAAAPREESPIESNARRLDAILDRLNPSHDEAGVRIEDLVPYLGVLPLWERLLRQYDAVIGYSTDGVHPLLCGKTPYFAYEHGTIRNIPFQPTTQGRLCAATYRHADCALITNCDNILAAEKLALPRFRFVPHPVNEDHPPDERSEQLAADLRAKLNSDFIIFHPARQHWGPDRHPDWEKGNDILIRGFANFVRTTAPSAAAVFVEWGNTLDASRTLIDELGIADRIHWIPPQPNRWMIRYIQACDLVADQFFLGAFGSLTPKAMLHGRPVMLHLDESRHTWCFPEMPPVISANTPGLVEAGLRLVYENPQERLRLATEGRRWYDRFHSAQVITETLAEEVLRCVTPAASESAGARSSASLNGAAHPKEHGRG